MKTADLLGRLKTLINRLRSTTSIKEKQEYLRNSKDLHSFLHNLYTSGPLHVTSKSLQKSVQCQPSPYDEDIESLLRDLESRKITGHQAIGFVQHLIRKYPDYKGIIENIIDKDFGVRLAAKSILATIGPVEAKENVSVSLAEDYLKPKVKAYLESSLGQGDTWYGSRKLDGIRCLATVKKSSKGTVEIDLRSRQNSDLNHLFLRDVLKSSFLASDPGEYALDGEICYFEGDCLDRSREDFRKVCSFVRSKTPNKLCEPNIRFILFDCVSRGNNRRILSNRHSLLSNIIDENQHIKILSQTLISNIKEFEELRRHSRNIGWEGLVLRRDVPHQGKRSKDMIKVKDFSDAEFEIIGHDLELMGVVKDGREAEELLLAAIHVRLKSGNMVKVGSGFTLEERRSLRDLGNSLHGKLATVRYFQETDTNGKTSLRFPTFKSIRYDGL